MRKDLPRALRLAFPLTVLAGSLSACGKARRPPPPPPPAPRPLPAALNIKGISIHWQQRAKSGSVERLLDLRAQTGKLVAASQSGEMQKASGTLYRDNAPRASFTAPIVDAAANQKSVTARGGVVVKSIGPDVVTVSADTVTWFVEQNKIIATGNVRFQRVPAGSSSPDAWGGPFPRLTVDTELQRLHIP